MDKKLKEMMAELFRVPADEIKDTMTMKDTAAWDSLKHMELIVAIEQGFNVALSFDEIVSMCNIGSIKQVLRNKGIED